ncbi:hypothetical protein [Prevotella sp. E2-28]|nr:hypothetical protein [Prevotella sp. E2-28]UKK53653.1 hypothetical protein L6465_13925 [Prevotella sp. E2-28]
MIDYLSPAEQLMKHKKAMRLLKNLKPTTVPADASRIKPVSFFLHFL